MNADEPGQLPGVDLVVLAGLVADLLAPQHDPEAVAARCAARVIAELRPLVERIEAAAAQERRSIHPYVPRPGSSPN